jgi:hypothetical protein
MVYARKNLTLTDFLNRTFAGENAKCRDFCGGNKSERDPLYHAGINHGAVLRISAA